MGVAVGGGDCFCGDCEEEAAAFFVSVITSVFCSCVFRSSKYVAYLLLRVSDECLLITMGINSRGGCVVLIVVEAESAQLRRGERRDHEGRV